MKGGSNLENASSDKGRILSVRGQTNYLNAWKINRNNIRKIKIINKISKFIKKMLTNLFKNLGAFKSTSNFGSI